MNYNILLNSNMLQFAFAGADFFKDMHVKPCTSNGILRCKSFITNFLSVFQQPLNTFG
jgi:hypothetical protein